jgi:cytochrome c peroxidase
MVAGAADPTVVLADGETVTLISGHLSLRKWLVPKDIPAPADNATTPERVKLGEMLFFDARLSVHGHTSCVMCHFPERGFADGLPASVRFMGERMTRNSPGLVNVAYMPWLMWDGRNATLEQQALSSQAPGGSLNAGWKQMGITDPDLGIDRIKSLGGYVRAFAKAYPGEAITRETVAKAIAAFERSLVSRDSPFDRWVRGDAGAMTPSQVNGFRVFVDPAKGNCAACHAAPHFTDGGFHNLGLRQFGQPGADAGRFNERAIASMKGAFRTPSLRDVELTAPYFHDGSAGTLREVVEHYARGGDVKTNLSPLVKPLTLSSTEKDDLVSFMRALTTRRPVYDPPRLPR